jgi:hypothetical protein
MRLRIGGRHEGPSCEQFPFTVNEVLHQILRGKLAHKKPRSGMLRGSCGALIVIMRAKLCLNLIESRGALIGFLFRVARVGVAGDGVFGGGGFFVLMAAEEAWLVGFAVRGLAADGKQAGAKCGGKKNGGYCFHGSLQKFGRVQARH